MPLTELEPSLPQECLNIVILGASFAGLSVAHNVLSNIIPALSTFEKAPKYRVVLVSPSSHIFWNISAPKGLVSSQLIPYTDSFIRIVDGFERYPSEHFTFIQGTAGLLDTDARTVTVTLSSRNTTATANSSRRTSTMTEGRASTIPEELRPAQQRDSTTSSLKAQQTRSSTVQVIPYHALILATGSSANSPLLSLHGNYKKTVAALDEFHERLRDANSILVVGGGPSGVETAGQLAIYFNRQPLLSRLRTYLSARLRLSKSSTTPNKSKTTIKQSTVAWDPPRKPKTITILSGHSRLLPLLAPQYGHQAERHLRANGVHILHNTRLVAAREDAETGRSECHLDNDTTIHADLHVACTGVYPNTHFVPSRLLDGAGYVVTDAETLRVRGAGERVFALGDCAAYSNNYTLDVYDALPAVTTNLKNDLLAYEARLRYREGDPLLERVLAALVDRAFVQNPTNTLLMPCRKRGGVGILFDWKVPSFAVWALKGRDYKVPKAREVVEKGVNPYG